MLFSVSLRSHNELKSIAEAEEMINLWMKLKNCAVATVHDVDLFERKVLVKARGIYFVLTAKDSSTYEICPIGKKVGKRPTLDPK